MSKKVMCVAAVVLLPVLAGNAFAQIGPPGWWDEHIGDGVPGKSVVKGTTYEITGDGHDIWDSADGFQYLYKKLTGDGSMTARVVSNGTGSNTWAKGGVMIRANNTAGSADAYMVITGGDGNGAGWQWRPTQGAGATWDGAGPTNAVAPPYWVKIERTGNVFKGSISPDGKTWTQQGTTRTITMPDPVLIGLCVTSHAAGELRTFVFDNVSYTGNVADKAPQLKAWIPSPADGAVGVTMPLLQWAKGETALFHNVYFGTTPDLTEANLVAARQPFPMYFHAPGLQAGTTYYWRVDEIEANMVTIHTGDLWSFTSEPLKAFAPTPADGAGNLMPAPTLSWQPGKGAIEHQIYFASNLAAVTEGAAAAGQGKVAETTFKPGVLRASTTYYWRIDEVKADGGIEPGEIWSFSTQDGVANKIVRQWWDGIGGTALSALTGSPDYPDNPTGSELLDTFEGPTDVADNYGSRLYGWLKPPQNGDYTFWMASDDYGELRLSTDADPANGVPIATVPGWTNSQEWGKYPAQKSAPIALKAGQKYYIQVIMKEGGGGDNVAVSWQGGPIVAQTIISAEYVDAFALPPLQAFSPNPANRAVDAPQTGVLSWSAGEKATRHEVYFGEDAAAVAAADTASALYKGQQAGTTFNAGSLEWGKTYYWRVDELNPAQADSPWPGPVWSFTTANFIPLEDFESYTDDDGNRIYQTWIDGWTNGTGSQVGNLVAPFAERTIVHGGKQAMPLDYNNTKSPFYSEAEYVFAAQQDWTTHGVDTLSLWVRGNPGRFSESAGVFTLGASGHDIWDNADDFRFVYKRLTGNGSITAKVESVADTNGWAKAGVMIREELTAGSRHGATVVTPSNGVSFPYRLFPNDVSVQTNTTGLTAPQWVRITRTGDVFKAEYSANGTTWTAQGTDQTILMTPNVYIGLCLTSHNSAATTTGVFSNVTTTGTVTGQWQQVWLGDDPDRTNGADTLYVALEDSTGKTAASANPTLVNATTWTEWPIPLSDFAGVNLARIKKMYLGVGDRKAPAPGGSGRVYIDDIRVTKP